MLSSHGWPAMSEGRTICVGTGTECLQDVSPSPEVCDALDNDCDGEVDDTDEGALCSGNEVCAGGNCIVPCYDESFCPAGLVCDTSGMCVEEDCLGVECPEGQRCLGGVCVGACDGVVCPYGQECRAGNCIDLCEGMTCDSCTVCEDGICVPTCDYTPCPVGETCDANGHCIEDDCLSVSCSVGFHCEGGVCIDNCDGVTCPMGQICELGECVPGQVNPDPDAGVPTDAGPSYPDAWVQVADASGTDTPPTDSAGCTCRSGADDGSRAGTFGLFGLFALLLLLRRRREPR